MILARNNPTLRLKGAPQALRKRDCHRRHKDEYAGGRAHSLAFILGHEDGIADEQARVRLGIYYAKTRMGWNQTVADRRERVGDPTNVRQRLEVNSR